MVAIFSLRNIILPPKVATGFEPRIGKQREEFRQLSRTLDDRAPPIERAQKALTLVSTKKRSRGDWTPLELFIVGVRGWDARSRQCLEKLTFKRASAGSSRLADLVGLHPFLKGTQGLG
jgi:hypothetical protein